MSLAKALQKYYTREGKKLIFLNNKSLNQFALSMWERLDYQQIDASVLSRVINGERLFTQKQLKIFCDLLGIQGNEKELLFKELHDDYLIKNGFYPVSFDHSLDTNIELIEDIIKEGFYFFYNGDTYQANRLSLILQTHIESLEHYKKSDRYRSKLGELKALSLYLQGRYLTSITQSNEVLKKSLFISNEILSIANQLKSKRFYSYAYTLLSDIYYVAGGYSRAKIKREYFKQAINFGKLSLTYLPLDDPESVVTIRDIIAATIFLDDRQKFLQMSYFAEDILIRQPIENAFSSIHLVGTLQKGFAYFHEYKSLKIKSKFIKHFGKDLQGAGAWEISDIKTELETLKILDTNDKDYFTQLIQRGLKLAEQKNLIRHKKYFLKLKNYY